MDVGFIAALEAGQGAFSMCDVNELPKQVSALSI
jgi:hypothetical protein